MNCPFCRVRYRGDEQLCLCCGAPSEIPIREFEQRHGLTGGDYSLQPMMSSTSASPIEIDYGELGRYSRVNWRV